MFLKINYFNLGAKSGYRVLREIRRLQKSTNLLLLKLPFTRLVKIHFII